MLKLSGCAALFGALAVAGPALASDVAYCAVVGGASYQAEARLRAAECYRSEEIGTTKIYDCESGNPGISSFGGHWYAYRMHGEGAFDPRQRTRDCGFSPSDSPRTWNNPVVADIHRVGSRTVTVIRTPIPLPDSPDFSGLTYVVSEADPDSGLRSVADYPGDVGLILPSSEARVAGVDIVTAKPAALEAALVERGSQRLTYQCVSPQDAEISTCLIGTLTTTYPEDSVGAAQVKAQFGLGRIMSTEYGFTGQEGYLAFVTALDNRYGASTRTSARAGCTVRDWTAGGVQITGQYCGETDAKITFFNSALFKLFAFYRTDFESLVKSLEDNEDEPARPRGDMF